MKLTRRLFSKVLIGNSLILFPSLSFADIGLKVYPSVSVLAEKCISLNRNERKEALNHLVQNVTSETEINAFINEIHKKLEIVPHRKVNTRKEQVLNFTVEGDIIHAFLQIDHFEAKCFVLNRLLHNENEKGMHQFELPVYLDGIAPNTYPSYRSIMSIDSLISSQDILDIIVSDCFNYEEERIRLIGTLLSSILIQKYKNYEYLSEEDARAKIINVITNDYLQRTDPSKRKLLDKILYICENVQYEMKLLNIK